MGIVKGALPLRVVYHRAQGLNDCTIIQCNGIKPMSNPWRISGWILRFLITPLEHRGSDLVELSHLV